MGKAFFRIFASRETDPRTNSKQLKKIDVEGEALYGAYVEELNDQGYTINDVWLVEEDHVTTNMQNPRRNVQHRNRKGGYSR